MASTYGKAVYGISTYGDSSVGIENTSSPQSVMVDLEQVYELDYINVNHGKPDGRTFHGTKTEVSEDGITWVPLFNSSIVGEYAETKDGHTVLVNQGNITYNTQGQIDGAATRITNAESEIIQQADLIETKVDVNGIISSINQTAEKIKIDASKIDLNGYVTVTNLETPGETTINGGNIKGGTITLGGANNGNGQMSILDSSGSLLATINGSGYVQNNGLELGHRNEINSANGVYLNYRGGAGADYGLAIGAGTGIMDSNNLGTLLCGDINANTLSIKGSKNCIQKTEHYGERAINAYETAEYFFGDIGRGKVENGSCSISIEDIFKECVNTSIKYHIFLTKYGKGDIWVAEMNTDYFIVKGDDISFSWELKAKRIGYEGARLEEFKSIDFFKK